MLEATRVAELFPLVVDTGVRGLVLLSLAGLFALCLRGASASARHLVWSLALVGMLTLPALRAVVPRVEVGLPSPASIPGLAWVDPGPREDAGAAVTPAPDVSAGDRSRADGRTGAVASAGPGMAASSAATGGDAGGAAARQAAGAGPGMAASSAVTGGDAGGAAARQAAGAVPGIGDGTGDAVPAADISVGGLLFVVWLGVAVALLVPVVVGWLAVRKLGRRSDRLTEPRVRHLATRLALRIGLQREFRLLVGPPRTMPMTWGIVRPTVVLPPESLDWPPSRLEAVLLHELAHVARRDCLTQLVAEVARALHWFNPLAWVAARRLRVEREHACDDVALEGGARATDYADELLGLARTYHASRTTTMAAVAMARPSQLADRLLAVLDERRSRRGLDRAAAARATVGAGVLLLGLAAAAPATPLEGPDRPPIPAPPTSGEAVANHHGPVSFDIAPPPTPPAPDAPAPSHVSALGALEAQEVSCAAATRSWNSISHSARNDRHTIKLEGRDCELEVRLEGDVEFDAAGATVARMGRNALIRIDEDAGRTERYLEVRPGADGRPQFAYRIDGRAVAFDAEGQDWYRSVLIQLFRGAGFAAEQRVDSILERSGVEGVLAELGRIDASHVFARYTGLLLEKAELDEAEVRALVRGSAGRVDSDHYLAEILTAVAEHQPLRGGTLDDVIVASTTLDSDHYRSEVLSRVLRSDDLSSEQVTALLASIRAVDSDHYRSELLRGVADRYARDPAIRRAYLDAATDMGSDHYRNGVLGDLLRRDDLSDGEIAAVLDATRRIDSDHYRGEILSRVADRGLTDAALQRAYFDALGDFDSDHYHTRALVALAERPDLPDDLLVALLRSAGQMESSHSLSQVLLTVARTHRLDGPTRSVFVDVMDGIESKHYRGQVADALIRAERR